MTRLSIPGYLCTHCGAVMGESIVCPGCKWADPLTRRPADDRAVVAEDLRALVDMVPFDDATQKLLERAADLLDDCHDNHERVAS